MNVVKRSFRTSSVVVALLALVAARAHADSPDGGTTPDGGAPTAAPQPIPVTILTSNADTAPGLIFLTPNSATGGVNAAQIVDRQARPVWFHPLSSGTGAYDLRVQRYRREPVLTWIESKGAFSTGPTTDYIADDHYHVIATVSAGHGLTADIHEFFLTPWNTALITVYSTVTRDLSSVGGSTSGLVTEGVIQEIDIPTGNVLFEWHSLDHIGLDESHNLPVPTSGTTAWDYFHLNAVSIDEDGNLLVGARDTWAAYRIDRYTGAVLWRLGGTKSTFTLGPNVAFAWQHNPTAVDDHGLIRIFDNEASPTVLPYSRVIWVRHDDVNKTATLERWFKHPDNLSAGSQGNAEGLPNGDTFVGWGALPRFSEFDRNDNLLFDAALPQGYNSYRAFKNEWVGLPDTKPTASAQVTSDGNTSVQASWNGATEVARWDVVDVATHGVVATADWNGLETTIQVDEPLSSIVVVARDAAGLEIGRSAVTVAAE
jgi:hypothetical protein